MKIWINQIEKIILEKNKKVKISNREINFNKWMELNSLV
jgi:hypothetical protein